MGASQAIVVAVVTLILEVRTIGRILSPLQKMRQTKKPGGIAATGLYSSSKLQSHSFALTFQASIGRVDRMLRLPLGAFVHRTIACDIALIVVAIIHSVIEVRTYGVSVKTPARVTL